MKRLLNLTPSGLRRAHGSRAARGDDGVAMITALIAIMVTAMLSILLLGILMSQMMPTVFLRTSSKTVFGAEAGINAVIGQIRNAGAPPDATGTVYGDNAKLPCTAQGPVDGTSTSVTYSATVDYFITDPTGQSASWLAAHKIPCTPGSGPAQDPGYAMITSTGEDTVVAGLPAEAGDRTVSVIYEFQVTNNNIPGGLIYSFDPAHVPDRNCLEAYSATVGSHVKYVPAEECGTNDVHQLWIYDTDYQIKLASTTLPTLSVDPLCITGPTGGSSNERATLQPCKADSDPDRWNQLWSWWGGAKWRGQKSSITGGYSDLYLYSGSTSGAPPGQDLTGRDLWVGPHGANNNEWGSFNPDPRVGAGAAGKDTNQIVNYLEFGRCFDVTNENVGYSFMIVYPCKQDPIPGDPNLFWNHKWYYTEPPSKVGEQGPQQIYVLQHNDPGKKYCLVSPGTEGGYVYLTSSCSSSAANQRWTRQANTGSYASSWRFVDYQGRCAALGDKYDSAWSKITTTTCNSGLGQKWNAPPNTMSASLGGYQEIP